METSIKSDQRSGKLTEVSTDVLSAILAVCDGHDLGHLWLCGDTRLNMLMAHGGVSSFSLGVVSWRKYLWPQLVCSFSGLRVLHLISPTLSTRSMPFSGFSWSLVPSGVVDLSIQSESLSSLGLACDGVISASLTSLHISIVSYETFGLNIVWCDRFPNLETLNIPNGISSPLVLPRHLTALRVGLIDHRRWDPASNDGWPSTLTSLAVNVQYSRDKVEQPERWIASLAPRLQHLETGSASLVWKPEPPLDWSQLVSAVIPYSTRGGELPPNLTRLQIATFPPVRDLHALLKSIPPRVTSLDIPIDDILRTEHLQLLPKSVTELAGSDDDVLRLADFDTLALLPMHTRAVSVQEIEGKWALPSELRRRTALRCLKLRSDETPSCLENFPPRLETLHATFFLSVDLLEHLPTCLTELRTHFPTSFDPIDAFPLLPRGLKKLQAFGALPLHPDSSRHLPRGLEELTTSGFFVDGSGEPWFENLPPSLTTLGIFVKNAIPPSHLAPLHKRPISTLSIWGNRSWRVPWSELLPLLPPRLTKLDCERHLHDTLTPSDLSLLPRGLISCTLPGSIHIRGDRPTAVSKLRKNVTVYVGDMELILRD